MFVVISYDTPDDKRRGKFAKTLLDSGAERVQRSVFEGHLESRDLTRLHSRLARIHDPEEDSIRIYTLCATCRPRTLFMGRATPVEEPGLRII